MIKLYHADCMKKLDAIEEQSIDCIVTSPPYNLGKKYNTHNDRMKVAEYYSWLFSLFYKSRRVLKEEGSFFLNFGYKPSDPMKPFWVVHEAIKAQFEVQNVIHWVKSISINDESVGHIQPINSAKYLSSAHEYIFHLTKTGKNKIDRLAIGVPYQDKSNVARWKREQDLRCRGNVWFIPYETIQKRIGHPTPFPPQLPAMCIKLHGISKDMMVMDPLMGNGNTGMAAQRLGVNFIGIEVDKEYFEVAKQKIMMEEG